MDDLNDYKLSEDRLMHDKQLMAIVHSIWFMPFLSHLLDPQILDDDMITEEIYQAFQLFG